MRTALALPLALLILLSFHTASYADEEAIRVVRSTRLITEVITEKGLADPVLKEARAVAIIPDVIKLAFIAGGRHGSGVLSVRDAEGGWSHPVFISITGASFGLQVGAQAIDLVLVFRTEESVKKLYEGKFTIGADASVAAGPLGIRGEAATDVKFKADIHSYSMTRGVFAGVSLDGAGIVIDNEANAAFYGRKGIRAEEIFSGKGLKESEAVDELKAALGR